MGESVPQPSTEKSIHYSLYTEYKDLVDDFVEGTINKAAFLNAIRDRIKEDTKGKITDVIIVEAGAIVTVEPTTEVLETEQLTTKILVQKNIANIESHYSHLKNILGADLYNEIVNILESNKILPDEYKAQAYLNFDKEKAKKLRNMFLMYKDDPRYKGNTLTLYCFLSDYAKYTGAPRPFPKEKENNLSDVTQTFDYTQLVAETYLRNPVF
jgi:hypothetical protein